MTSTTALVTEKLGKLIGMDPAYLEPKVKSLRRILWVSALAYVVMKYGKKVFAFWKESQRRASLHRKLPGPSPGEKEHWLVGHAGAEFFIRGNETFDMETWSDIFMPRMLEMIRSPRFRNEGMLRIYPLNSSIPFLNSTALVFLFDMNMMRKLLAAKSMPLYKKGTSYEMSRPLIGDGVLSTSGHKWMKQRPAVENGMKHEVLKPGLPQVVKTANELTDKLDKLNPGEDFAAHEEMFKLTMDVIGRVAFDWDFGSVTAETTSDAPLYDAFQVILMRLAERAMNPALGLLKFLPTRKNKSLNENLARLEHQVERIIAAGYRKLDEGDGLQQENKNSSSKKTRFTSILNELLLAERAGDLTPKEVRDNIKTLLFAGHDTTGAALSWAFYLLTKHPEAQQRLYDEICEHCGPNGDPTYDGLEEMEFLNAVVLEVLRLYPSAGFTRLTLEDVDLGNGRIIPKGTEIFLFPYITQRDPQAYDRPDEFVPERWMASEGGSEAKYCGDVEKTKHSESGSRAKSIQSQLGRHSMNRPMLPFSLGQRGCVGRPLALMEIRVVVIKMLQRFKLQFPEKPDPEFQEVPIVNLTLNPKSVRLVPVPRATSIV